MRDRPAARLFGSLAPLGMSLWLAAATVWYVWTAVQALRHPFNTGADLLWVGIWLVFVTLVLLSRALFGPTAGTRPWVLALIAVAIVMAVLSRQGTAALITLWVLALAWALGDWLLGRLRATPPKVPFEHACLAVSLGLCLLAFLALLLALSRTLTAAWAYAVLILMTLLRGRPLWDCFTRTVRNNLRSLSSPKAGGLPEHGPVMILLGFVALVNFAWALAPEIQFDATNYQLAVPAIYVAQHKLVNLPLFFHSYFAHMVNMLFGLALALDGQAGAKLLVFAIGILAALGIYALGRSLFSDRVGLWAAAIFYTTPIVGWLSSTAYVDLPVTLFLLASLLALLRWRTTRRDGWLLAAGLLAGAALGTKLTAIYGVLALLVALAAVLLRSVALPAGAKVRALAVYLLGLGLFAAPWYLIVLFFTGSPVFPMFNGIFRSPGWPPKNTNFNAGLFGIGTSPGSLLKLPFALTFESHRFGESLPSGGVGLALVLLPVGLALSWKSVSGRRLLLAVITCYLIFWAFNTQYARYYVPILPLVCVLAMGTVASLSSRRGLLRMNLALVALVLVAQESLLFVQYWNIPERVPARFAFGTETQDAFLARALPAYDAVRLLNSVVRTGEKAISAGADSMRFYVKPPLASMAESFELQELCGSFPPAQVARNLAKNGYAYLLVSGEPAAMPPFPYLRPEFLSRSATLAFSGGSVKLYRLRLTQAEADVLSAENLLDNAGFETLDPSGLPESWIPYGQPAVVRDASQAHAGRIAVLSDSKDGLSQPVMVRPGSRYILRNWTRAAAAGSSARLQVNWLDEGGQMVDVNIEVVPTSPQWVSHEMLVTAPQRATTAILYASVHENGKVLFDDFSFAAAGQPPSR